MSQCLDLPGFPTREFRIFEEALLYLTEIALKENQVSYPQHLAAQKILDLQ